MRRVRAQGLEDLFAPTKPLQPVFPHILRGSAVLADESIGDARILKAVKLQCGAAGLPPRSSAHSFRSGFIITGAKLVLPAHTLQQR